MLFRSKIIVSEATWVKVWKQHTPQIVLFTLLLMAVTVVYALRDHLTRRSTHKNKWPVNSFKFTFWVIFVFWVGFGLMA